ncbi:unnamed protein product [Rotaria magnacalcarata]|uniref:TIR domain-containing protein n=1 Tax=Rotaria magnacalcarata TaxID=392030 RepID=A0A820BQF3_9BILA|nr:unnamed protein product [Rotaria magnacalcarata]CAF4205254.1 unnamed protein product [Rotaria magnacalcarata]
MMSATTNKTIYKINHVFYRNFFVNPAFCECVQQYLHNLLSLDIAIVPIKKITNSWSPKTPTGTYNVNLLGIHENTEEVKQIVADFFNGLFKTIHCQTFTNSEVKDWLRWPSQINGRLRCLQNVMDEKLHHVFTICEAFSNNSLSVHYLAKELFSSSSSEEIDQVIQREISAVDISLPFSTEQSSLMLKEAQKITGKVAKDRRIFISKYTNSTRNNNPRYINLFGYFKLVNELKDELLNMIARRNVIALKLNLVKKFQVAFLSDDSSGKLKEIEKKHKQFGANILSQFNEFCTSQLPNDDNKSSIAQIISETKLKTFKSLSLPRNIVNRAEKHLGYIARKYLCCIITESKYRSRPYIIPKATSSQTEITKSMIDLSDSLISSSDVFNTIVFTNGSIEIRTGDISLQEVDTIVISATFNGLKEGVIERAGKFDYEKTYTDETGTRFTETNGGQLSCKQFLFSNWTPSSNTNDNDLRQSIQMFISKCIEYTSVKENTKSIAFAVPDSCTNEVILANEMVNTIKNQLESKKLQMRFLFILLPEQQTLRNRFFDISIALQSIYAQFDWPSTVIKITLIGFTDGDIIKCQEKIDEYFERCIISMKLMNPNGIFHHWDQYKINAFYKYCKDRCVLPQIHRSNNELELMGTINDLREVEQKWNFFCNLVAEKLLRMPSIKHRSVTTIQTARSQTRIISEQNKFYDVILSYCQEDNRKCQCLANRLIEEGFSIWAEPVIADQQRDVSSQIDKSSCIIICISENHYEKWSCQKEARYALQSGKRVFLAKIRNDPLVGWQREIFEGKFFFQMFGSENHFDMEFGKLLLEILRYCKCNTGTIIQETSDHSKTNNNESDSFFSVEERRSIYEKKIKALTDISRIQKKEMKMLVEQLQNVMDDVNENKSTPNTQTSNDKSKDPQTSEILNWIKRWLRKSTNIIKQNLPPFSPTGDINDALFPMPEYFIEYLGLHLESFSTMQSSQLKLRNIFENDIFKRPIRQPSKRVLFGVTTIDKERTYGCYTQKTDDVASLLEAFSEKYPATDHELEKPTRLPLISLEISSPIKRQILNRRKLHDTHTLKKKEKYIPPTRKELKVYLEKFAERMHENAIQFKNFCSLTTASTDNHIQKQ